jgi:membrane-associated protease RseP (regulator of RpoE activity)
MKTQTMSWFAAVAMLLILPDSSPAQEEATRIPVQTLPELPVYELLIENQRDLAISFPLFENPAGVEVAALGATLRSQLNLPDDIGVVVTRISPESPAAKAGMKQHDILLKIGDAPLTSPDQLNQALKGEGGKQLKVSALREGKPLSMEFTLPKPREFSVQLAPAAKFSPLSIGNAPRPSYRLGVTLAEADDTLRTQLKLAAGEGLVVTEVLPDSPAVMAGVQQHDVLIKLDGKRLSTVEAINAQIQELKDRAVTLVFLRAGEEKSCEVAAKLSEVAGALDAVQWSGHFWQPRLELGGTRAEAMSGLTVYWPQKPVTTGSVADQLTVLKKQLAEMQTTLETLETALQAQVPTHAENSDPGR